MNKPDTWYVQKAVELADGWYDRGNEFWHQNFGHLPYSYMFLAGNEPMRDALAAQLVRDYSKISPNDRLCYADDVMETIRYVVDKLHSR